MEYRVVIGSFTVFVSEVESLLCRGWKLYGNIVATVNRQGTILYLREMVREEEPSEEELRG